MPCHLFLWKHCCYHSLKLWIFFVVAILRFYRLVWFTKGIVICWFKLLVCLFCSLSFWLDFLGCFAELSFWSLSVMLYQPFFFWNFGHGCVHEQEEKVIEQLNDIQGGNCHLWIEPEWMPGWMATCVKKTVREFIEGFVSLCFARNLKKRKITKKRKENRNFLNSVEMRVIRIGGLFHLPFSYFRFELLPWSREEWLCVVLLKAPI